VAETQHEHGRPYKKIVTQKRMGEGNGRTQIYPHIYRPLPFAGNVYNFNKIPVILKVVYP
jgi:hypothetical protein